jgi:hypothetical protein
MSSYQLNDVDRAIAASTELKFSEQIDQIAAALVKARRAIQNPVKNREVEIYSKRTNAKFKFRFADLAAVLDAINLGFGESGLALLQPLVGNRLVTLVLHESGQWMRAEVELLQRAREGDEASSILMAFGGVVTYMRRYCAMSVAGVAGEDGSDADIAERSGSKVLQRTIDPAADPDVHPVIGFARQVASIADGVALLRYWLTQRGEVETLRGKPAQEQLWLAILAEAAAALNRSLGGTVALAWKSFQLATTREHERAVCALLDGEWSEPLANFRRAERDGHGSLMQHINAARERIAAAYPAETSQDKLTELTDETAEPPPPPAAPGPRVFAFHLFDAQGEVASEILTDAIQWASAFRDAYVKSDDGERENLEHHNADALTAADHVVGAQVILLECFEDPDRAATVEIEPTDEQLQVAKPLKANNVLDVLGYLRAMEGSLRDWVRTKPQMERWLAINEPHYMAEDMPPATKLKILRLVAGIKRALGYPMPRIDQAA